MIVHLYHHPRCSKSRAALEWLQAQPHLTVNTILYQTHPPSLATLQTLMKQLNISDPREMMRQKDEIYQAHDLGNPAKWSNDALLAFLAEHPALLERPIAVVGERAAIGRPLENIIALIA